MRIIVTYIHINTCTSILRSGAKHEKYIVRFYFRFIVLLKKKNVYYIYWFQQVIIEYLPIVFHYSIRCRMKNKSENFHFPFYFICVINWNIWQSKLFIPFSILNGIKLFLISSKFRWIFFVFGPKYIGLQYTIGMRLNWQRKNLTSTHNRLDNGPVLILLPSSNTFKWFNSLTISWTLRFEVQNMWRSLVFLTFEGCTFD